jgi:hypothetical protein
MMYGKYLPQSVRPQRSQNTSPSQEQIILYTSTAQKSMQAGIRLTAGAALQSTPLPAVRAATKTNK